MPSRTKTDRPNLIAQVTGGAELRFDSVSESVWVDVIKRMDEVYSELLRNEADLERKNSELEEAQAFISSVIASVSDILIVADEKAAIRQANRAFMSLVGRAERELVGVGLADFVVEADRSRLYQLLASGREGKIVEADINFTCANGEIECLAIRCSAQFTSDRRRIGAVLSGRPISELRRAYQALHEAHVDLQQAQNRLIEQEKMASLGRLVAGVAHELNNPISFIYANIYALDRYQKTMLAYLDEVHSRAPWPRLTELRAELKIDRILADYKPLMEGTIEGANRVSEIVKNLRRLSFSKTSERAPLDLEKVLRTAASLTARSKNSSAEFVFDCEPGLTVEANEGQVHQVFVNLIDNALHAVRDVSRGRISIRARMDGEMAEIAIRDNGPGIPAKSLDKVFEPFFTTKTVGEGTGLGLWISFSIVTENYGSLTASNLPEGGAQFIVRLPNGSGRARPSRSDRRAEGGAATILPAPWRR